MGTFAAYSDAADFLANGAANVETASLLGGNAVLTGPVAAGATVLPVSGTTGFPSSGVFPAYILDGLLSERVLVTVSGATLTVTGGTLAAHAVGIGVSSAGTGGCLADSISRASRAMENYCRQGPDGGADRTLFAITRTEQAVGPSLRCAFNRDYALQIRPWRWPVQSLSAVAVQYGSDAALGLNVANAFLSTDGKLMTIPFQSLTPPPLLENLVGARGLSFSATWTYVAGPCLTSGLAGVPDDLRQACHLLVADLLAQRQNPYGLSEGQQGKVHRIYRHRGDPWTNTLRERAYELLAPYAQASWGRQP